MLLARYLLIVALALMSSACTSFGVIANKPLLASENGPSYTIEAFTANLQHQQTDELMLNVAFSGGGTRAAALSYGVMLELRDTKIQLNGQDESMLKAINVISSVSGGSFTSAYYGLHGDRLFVDFEERFLRHDIEGALLRGILNPLEWLGHYSRTDVAVAYYQERLFGKATFTDMMRKGSPLILINTSELSTGARFSFTQEYFNLLCSDLSSFSLARAVTASSAVPVLFAPVVVENYSNCQPPSWLASAAKDVLVTSNPDLQMIVQNNMAFENKTAHQFAQFVDGGITDNLGLRAIVDGIELLGGAKHFIQKNELLTPQRIAIISVNAAANSPMGIGRTNRSPSIAETLNAVTNIQLQRYNVTTIEETKNSLNRWAQDLSTPKQTVTPYFISLSFDDVSDAPLRNLLNEIPTSFSLSSEEVDRLIATGRQLLRENPEFQRLVASLKK